MRFGSQREVPTHLNFDISWPWGSSDEFSAQWFSMSRLCISIYIRTVYIHFYSLYTFSLVLHATHISSIYILLQCHACLEGNFSMSTQWITPLKNAGTGRRSFFPIWESGNFPGGIICFVQQGATYLFWLVLLKEHLQRFGDFFVGLMPKQLPPKRKPSSPFFWWHFLSFIRKETPLFFWGGHKFWWLSGRICCAWWPFASSSCLPSFYPSASPTTGGSTSVFRWR